MTETTIENAIVSFLAVPEEARDGDMILYHTSTAQLPANLPKKLKILHSVGQVADLLDEGRTRREISRILGLRYSMVCAYAEKSGRKGRKSEIINKRIKHIIRAVRRGADTPEKVAKITGLSISTILGKVSQAQLQTPWSKELQIAYDANKIRDLLDAGKTRAEISKTLGLNYPTVCNYAKISGKPVRQNKTGHKRAEEIRCAISSGARSLAEISKRISLNENTVSYHMRRHKIKRPWKVKTKAERVRKIKKIIETKSPQYADEIANALKISIKYLYTGYRNLVNLPPFKDRTKLSGYSKDTKRIPIRDELAKKGLTLEKIAEEEAKITGKRLTRETIRLYLLATGQYELRKEAKEKARKY